MIFSKLKEAYAQEVREWIYDLIPELTFDQMEAIEEADIMRGSDLYFYKDKDPKKVTFWWRLTMFIFPFAWLILFIGLPLNMLITGEWGYSRKFNDKLLSPWMSRLHLD